MKKSPKIDCPMRFAHRGLVQYAPENTIPAYQAAIDYGCEGIEIDTHMTKDGQVIVCHDQHFARMTRGVETRKLIDMTLAEAQAVDLPYAGHMLPYEPPVPYSEHEGSARTYSDEQVAEMEKTEKRVTHLSSFKEFDKWFETVTENVIIEIELCNNGEGADEEAFVKAVFDVLWQSKNNKRYIAFSGNRTILKAMQDHIRANGKPEGLRIGANLRQLTEEARAFVESSDLYEVGLNDNLCTKEDVDWLLERGVVSFSNLGDYPEWWQAISDLGMVAFKTNYAEAYTDWKLAQDK